MQIIHDSVRLAVKRRERMIALTLSRPSEQSTVEIDLSPSEARVVATMLAETAREVTKK